MITIDITIEGSDQTGTLIVPDLTHVPQKGEVINVPVKRKESNESYRFLVLRVIKHYGNLLGYTPEDILFSGYSKVSTVNLTVQLIVN